MRGENELVLREDVAESVYPDLVDIWRSAINATHDFLSDTDRAEIESHLVSDYFPAVRLLVAERHGETIGFAGTHGDSLEMLFVLDDQRGTGAGSAMLAHVLAEHGVQRVDVNEQNPQAHQFYVHRGFVLDSRSETDEAGRPYPLLHLIRRERPA